MAHTGMFTKATDGIAQTYCDVSAALVDWNYDTALS